MVFPGISVGFVVLKVAGQGSQMVGMGQELAENFSEARRVFEEADETLGFKLSEVVFNGTQVIT